MLTSEVKEWVARCRDFGCFATVNITSSTLGGYRASVRVVIAGETYTAYATNGQATYRHSNSDRTLTITVDKFKDVLGVLYPTFFDDLVEPPLLP